MKQKCRVEVGEGGECRKMGHKCLERMTLKCRDVWSARSSLT